MNGFDLVSRVFALVLGLGIAEVLGGFARTWRVKARAEGDPAKSVHIGTLVPLLGLLVVTDQTGFWLAFYSLRDHLPFNFAGLVGVMAIIGLYYIISTFVFPQETERWPDFDDYYLLVRRTVVGGMIAVKIATLAYAVVLFAWGVAIKNETGTTSLAATLPRYSSFPRSWPSCSYRQNARAQSCSGFRAVTLALIAGAYAIIAFVAQAKASARSTCIRARS